MITGAGAGEGGDRGGTGDCVGGFDAVDAGGE